MSLAYLNTKLMSHSLLLQKDSLAAFLPYIDNKHLPPIKLRWQDKRPRSKPLTSSILQKVCIFAWQPTLFWHRKKPAAHEEITKLIALLLSTFDLLHRSAKLFSIDSIKEPRVLALKSPSLLLWCSTRWHNLGPYSGNQGSSSQVKLLLIKENGIATRHFMPLIAIGNQQKCDSVDEATKNDKCRVKPPIIKKA